MTVIIGVDPHKASHTAVAIDDGEERARPDAGARDAHAGAAAVGVGGAVRAADVGDRVRGRARLSARPAARRGRRDGRRCAGHVGVAGAGARRRAGRTRTTPTTRCRWRSPRCGRRRCDRFEPADHAEVLRLLAKRNIDIGNHRTRVVCRLHALLAELAPGGIAKELNASDVDRLLDADRPGDAGRAGPLRPRRRAARRHPPPRRPAQGVAPTDPRRGAGVGHDAHRPVRCRPDHRRYAHRLHRRRRRFANRDQYAAYNGTAPVEFSSGGRVVHRLSQRGNRRLNHAIHMAAICQIRQPHSEGRAYFDRKVAEGKTKKEALRALKRHISNAVYRQLVIDADAPGANGPGRTNGNDSAASVTGSHP